MLKVDITRTLRLEDFILLQKKEREDITSLTLAAAPLVFLILRRRNVRFGFVRSILIPTCERIDNCPSEAVSVMARNMSNDFFGTATLDNRARHLIY